MAEDITILLVWEEVRCMGFFDGLFGMQNKVPKIISILPLACQWQEIEAGRRQY